MFVSCLLVCHIYIHTSLKCRRRYFHRRPMRRVIDPLEKGLEPRAFLFLFLLPIFPSPSSSSSSVSLDRLEKGARVAFFLFLFLLPSLSAGLLLLLLPRSSRKDGNWVKLGHVTSCLRHVIQLLQRLSSFFLHSLTFLRLLHRHKEITEKGLATCTTLLLLPRGHQEIKVIHGFGPRWFGPTSSQTPWTLGS